MRIGMAGRPRMQTLSWRPIRHRLLRVLGNRVVLGVGPENRSSLAKRGEKRRRHLSRALFDLPSFLAQQIAVRFCRAILAECGLGVPPDLEMEVRQPLLVGIDPRQRGLLLRRDGAHGPSWRLWSEVSAALLRT